MVMFTCSPVGKGITMAITMLPATGKEFEDRVQCGAVMRTRLLRLRGGLFYFTFKIATEISGAVSVAGGG